LNPQSSYIVIGISVPPATAGQAGYYTLRYYLEFETTDTWFQTLTSPYSSTQWNKALEIVRHMMLITKNASHFAELAASLKNALRVVGGGIVKYGPSIGKFLQGL